MKTQATALSWLNAQVGQHLDYDHKYGQQCVDFFNFYYQFETGDNPYNDGYGVNGAKDLWNIANSRFTKVANSNTLIPQAGDIAVYGSAWGAGYGHVEVVIAQDTHGCWFVGENEHNDPSQGVVKVYRTWAQMNGLLGVLRFNWPAAITYVTLEQLTQLFSDLLSRAPDPSGINHYVGHYTYDFTKNDILHSAEYAARQRALATPKPIPVTTPVQPVVNDPLPAQPVAPTPVPPAPEKPAAPSTPNIPVAKPVETPPTVTPAPVMKTVAVNPGELHKFYTVWQLFVAMFKRVF